MTLDIDSTCRDLNNLSKNIQIHAGIEKVNYRFINETEIFEIFPKAKKLRNEEPWLLAPIPIILSIYLSYLKLWNYL